MIIKNLTWKKFLVRKLLEYIGNPEKSVDANKTIFWNINEPSFEGAINAFKENKKFKKNRKNGNELIHDILSFNPDDAKKLTPEIVEDLVLKYLELRADKNIAYSCIHNDKKHIHAHIAISVNEFRTSKIRNFNRKQYRQLRIDLEKYQLEKYPFLDKSIVFLNQKEKAKTKYSEKEYQTKTRLGDKKTTKENLKQLIRLCYEKANNKEHFFYLLMQEEKIDLYSYRNKTNGILYNNKKFRFSTLGISKLDLIELEKVENKEINERLKALKLIQNKQNKNRDLNI